MPATEQTWRSPKLMHVIFGVSSVIMLVTTLWMLAADHSREWKDYQRKFRDVEVWTTESRINELETATYEQEDARLEGLVQAAKAMAPSEEAKNAFLAVAEPQAAENGYKLNAVNQTYDQLVEMDRTEDNLDDQIAARDAFDDSLVDVVRRAKFFEDDLNTKLKFARADLDVVMSEYAIGVDEGYSQDRLAEIDHRIHERQAGVEELTGKYQTAKTHRKALEAQENAITGDIEEAEAALAKHRAERKRLEDTVASTELSAKKNLLTLPILDAFNSPLKINQIWLPHLTLNNNFRDVARFDRCITCHLGIDKTAPGSAIDAGYVHREPLERSLSTPETAPELEEALDLDDLGSLNNVLEQTYGLHLAESGLVNSSDVTIEVVWPRTRAADARLQSGDVLRYINDVKILNREQAGRYLAESVSWGKPITLKIERGVPHPYASHPRLDLFVGSLSPHKMGDVGCTACHDGQGSATAFKWASHTPNDPREASDWTEEHGWFNNHHWIYPMQPERFAESTCLKCHHDLSELEPSERFADPPAPKVMAGYHLIREYGCFGCHEINGYDSPSKRRGPDLRTEPPFSAAAAELLTTSGLSDEDRAEAEMVINHPDRDEVRMRLAQSIKTSEKPDPTALKMAGILGALDEIPGKLRKVGPSLRHVNSKVDFDFVASWVANPTDFRPSTKMPRFFGLWNHLLPEEVVDAKGEITEGNPGLDQSKRFEPVEVRAISTYLLEVSQPFEYLDPPADVTAEPSVERGRSQFQTRGCLACHQHPEFPDAKDTQGPNLANLGAKLKGSKGRKWLYSWVRAPNRYHARTVMPNLFLEPIKGADGKTTDPAADITAFLLSFKDWKATPPSELDDNARKSLDDLVKMYLGGTFTIAQTDRYAKEGIRGTQPGEVAGDEALLVVADDVTPEQLEHQKLTYLGRRSISRLGCSGCHDIPGYEDSKPIGTGLADWGRKESSKLAFEQIVAYLEQTEGGEHGVDDPHAHALDIKDMPADKGFYINAILHHERDGFIWQKLREPRSYDFRKTENKPYTDRLRMPKFNFDEKQREQVITFVLGLVSEPPALRYVYAPKPKEKAIQKGTAVLTKYNCTGCHTMQMDQWTFNYQPYDKDDAGSFQPPPPFTDYAFLDPYFTPKELDDSTKVDRRGLGHATLTGRPNPDVQEDPDTGEPLWYFELWKPVAIDGQGWSVGGVEVPVKESSIEAKRPPIGGNLARLLHPVVLENERKSNPNAKASDAWGWVPPPLVNEGRKVQTQWLHDFLLDPYPIRPAVVLRMPKFNMSSDEAAALVNYFAAKDDVEYPYAFDPRTRSEYLKARAEDHPDRLGDALTLITDNNYCVKCHSIGDFVPQGTPAALAPQLDRVSRRLRPEFLQDWLANPKRLLPYTGMPQNFPPDKPASQDLYRGTAEQQLQAVVDLLLNWPTFMGDKTSIRPLVKPATGTQPVAAGDGS